MNTCVIGVDPGKSGGIAFMLRGDSNVTNACPMPDTQGDVLAELVRILGVASAANCRNDVVCYMEKIPMFIGGSDIPGSTVAVMFENFGFCKGAVQALGVSLYEITPQTWMKSLGIGTVTRQRAPNGASAEVKKAIQNANNTAKREWKRKLRAEAQRRYPALKITLEKADAVLIADYGLRQLRVDTSPVVSDKVPNLTLL